MFKLIKSDLSKFEYIYNDMLLQFPKSELNKYSVYEKLLKKQNYVLYIAEIENQNVGYTLLFKDNKNRVLWLDYIAVLRRYHSSGCGKKIFENLKSEFPSFKGTYLEVEKPNLNDVNTLRRISFYKNLGAEKLDCKYFYPNVEGCIPMDLYFLPFDKGYFPKKEEIINTIEVVFHSLHSHHPHIKDVMKNIVI